jgi:hypothetical protein
MNTVLDLLRETAPPFVPKVEDPLVLRRAAYVSALQHFDWSFEFSDDYRRVRTCRAALEVLRHEQQIVDPTGALWLQNYEPGYGHPLPIVKRVGDFVDARKAA